MDPTKQPFSTSEPPPISDKAPHAENNFTYQPTSAVYPVESSSSHPPGPRLLHIYHNSLLSHNLTILAPDKTTTAYTIHANSGGLFSSKPHMKIYRGVPHPTQPDPPIGTATFHSTTRTMDLTLHGRPVSLSHHGFFSSRYEFPSAMGVLCWKSRSGFGKDLVCETAAGGKWVAKFEATSFAVEKRGRFEIISWEVGEEVVDEIVVSGLAVVEQGRRKRNSGAGAGVGAGAGGVAFAAGC